MFELLKPTNGTLQNTLQTSLQAQAETALAADQLSVGEFWLLASAFASLLVSVAITASSF